MLQNKDLSVQKNGNLLCGVVKQRSAQIMLINHTQLDKEPPTTSYADHHVKYFLLSEAKHSQETQTSKLY